MSEHAPEPIERLVADQREFLRFLEGRLGDRALAEDILQEAFLKGLTKLSSLRQDESVTAWFYRVLRNAVVDSARRRATASKRLAALARELEQPEAPPEVVDQVCQCVTQLAASLKPEYAEAVQRVELEGMSVKDFAERAGISAGNAAVRAFRAREALRTQVTRACGACAARGCLECTCSSAAT
jgi:RNA polymerase sigma-70 factor (ECF subfamily)